MSRCYKCGSDAAKKTGYCNPCAAAYATARRDREALEGKRAPCLRQIRSAAPPVSTCVRCGETKPTDQFQVSRTTHAVYDHCRPCLRRKRADEYRTKPGVMDGRRAYLTARRERERADGQYLAKTRAWKLATSYGLTVAQYDAMAAAQGGVCVICGKAPDRLVVDHHHGTGAVRGLLCGRCNTGIGFLMDSAENADRAAAYLRRTTPRQATGS